MPLLFRLVTYELPVNVHVEPLSTVTSISAPEFALFIAPVIVEESSRFRVRPEFASIVMLPLIVCPLAVSVTSPPFEPEVPHAAEAAFRKILLESLFVIVVLLRLIIAVVFVTKNTEPCEFVRLPPLIVNVPVPLLASPEPD